jgi:hypothetical protein
MAEQFAVGRSIQISQRPTTAQKPSGCARTQKLVGATANAKDSLSLSLNAVPWGQRDWKLILSTPERALLELLDELPEREA